MRLRFRDEARGRNGRGGDGASQMDALPGSEVQMREQRLETKSRANWRYDRGAACCNNMPCASNGSSRVCTPVYWPVVQVRRVQCTVYSLAIGLSPRSLPLLFCWPHSITLADYSALSTCKRRISTRPLPIRPRE